MVSIEVDKNDIIEIESSFKKLENEINDWIEPLRESSALIKEEATSNFDRQGYLYGKAWTPLKAGTVRQRESMGYGGHRPILVRTGALKRGTQVVKINRQEAIVENVNELAPYHQYGTRRGIPRRTILDVSQKASNAIGIIFGNYLYKLLRRCFG